jgi:hypothetical protein
MNQLTHEKRIAREKQLIDEQHANALENLGAGRFSRPHTPSIAHLENRGFHEQTLASAARRAKMQTPVDPQAQFRKVREMISTTLSQHRAITEQDNFLRLLETKYHAIRGNDKSYEAAINRYHNDMEQQRRERFDSIARISQQQQEQFRPAQMADAARFQQNFQSRHGKQTAAPEAQRESGRWENWKDGFYRARNYFSSRSHPYSQQRHEKSHARGGPAQGGPARDEPQPGQRRKMSRAKALVIMGFNSTSTPPYDALKKAFNKQALLLHPDKNLDNPEEAAIKFKKMRKAFNSLVDKGTSDGDSEGGGIIKRRHKRHKTSKKARRNTRRKTRGKTHRKSHRKSNKRR